MTSITARLADGVRQIAAADWDACAGSANPFVGHAFLTALEESGAVGGRSGWQPLPIIVDGDDGRPAAIAPAYIKAHSQGEYVFDHGWADAWERAGGDYYPKLQIAAPFSPVPGPRLLLRDPALAPALIGAVQAVVDQNDLSSAHATFLDEAQVPLFEAAGWLIRQGVQFHWTNRGYRDFDGFLDDLASRKRKAIRKERAAAVEGLTIRHLSGDAIRAEHWDAFWTFYQDTGSRKWGTPYLTRATFPLLGETMGDRVLLILAERDGVPIAGALISSSAITRRLRRRSCAVSSASRRARRASTSWRAAMRRCRPGRRITSPIPTSAARSPPFWSANARASRRTPNIWKR